VLLVGDDALVGEFVPEVDESLEFRDGRPRFVPDEEVLLGLVIGVGKRRMEELLLAENAHLPVEIPALPADAAIFLEVVVVHQSVGHSVEVLVVPVGDRLANLRRQFRWLRVFAHRALTGCDSDRSRPGTSSVLSGPMTRSLIPSVTVGVSNNRRWNRSDTSPRHRSPRVGSRL